MCGRFVLAGTYRALAEHFDLSGDIEFSPSWNIAPSTRICSITADKEGHRHPGLMKWGLIPSWAKEASIGHKLANARGETVAEKPSFRSAFRQRRCIIPATGFYEWKSEQGVKQPWYVSLKSGKPMAFAGLWETWHGEGEGITTCCIITTAANALMETIHDRMPVILGRDQWSAWLSPQLHDADTLLPLIRPHDPASMQAWPVSREVNRVGLRDDAGLVDPAK
ncbi:MAG: SOS response-associated peptidase [Gallionella sp.]|nr:SOS response-associated peptidase [Gallionella sp.]